MTERTRPVWADRAYPVTPEEVDALFRAATPPHPSASMCAAIARMLTEAMPEHYRRVPGLEALGRYHDVFPRQAAAIASIRRAIRRRLKVGPDPWFPCNWKDVLGKLDYDLTAAAPMLAGPLANDPPQKHWHRIGWVTAEMARMALAEVGHVRASASRHSRAALFTVAALDRIGIEGVSAVAVERMHSAMRRRLAKTDTDAGSR